MNSSKIDVPQSTIIAIWVVASIFIIVAIVSFVFSYIYYRKKEDNQNHISTVVDSFDFSNKKSKKWWIKYRSSGFLSLGVLFVLLSIGAISYILSLG